MEILTIAIKSISANKTRSILTILGIIIGISAVIALLALGQGAQSSILSEVQGIGTNTITIFPVSSFGGGFNDTSSFESLLTNKLDEEILNILEDKINFKEIDEIGFDTSRSELFSFKNNTKQSTFNGVNIEFFSIRNLKISSGRFFTQNEYDSFSPVIILGQDLAKNLFGESDPLSKNIRVGNNSFEVIGVLSENSSANSNNQAYLPFTSATSLLTGESGFSTIYVQVKSEEQINTTAIKIENALEEYYQLDKNEDAPFTVVTSTDLLSLTSTITSIFTSLLASIAGISLIVGGIGIMNIMLVSVTERTKEIGLRKAIGAKQSAILKQFLLEAIVLTLLGGIIGIIFGIIIGNLIGQLAGINAEVSLSAIALATSVSVIIGILFGFYPAYKAAQLNPIDALRYE